MKSNNAGGLSRPERIDVDIDKLHFDEENPRLPGSINRSDESEVLQWMIVNGDIVTLMAAIGSTDFSSAEAVLVIKKENCQDEYEVIEGNRRLAAVKLLSFPEKATTRKKTVKTTSDNAKYRPKEIPVLVYQDRSEILNYLGYRHITGIKSWGAEEKARYLKQLFDHHNSFPGVTEEEVFKIISEAVATKPYYAKKTLTTLALADLANEEAYWGLERLTEEDVKFSILGTALNYSDIVRFLGLDDVTDWNLKSIQNERAKELFKWIFQRTPDGPPVVRESRQLTTLAKVISTDEALSALRSGESLEHASELTDEAGEIFSKSLTEALKKIELAQSQLKRIENPDSNELDKLRSIWRIAKDIGELIKTRNKDDDEGF